MNFRKNIETMDWIKIFRIITIGVIFTFVALVVGYFSMGKSFNQYRIIFLVAIGSLAAFFFLYRKKIGEKPEFGFLMVALVCGSLLVVSEPKKFVNWDEQIHYKRVERFAAGFVKNFPSRPNFVHSSFSLEEQGKINEQIDGQYKKPKSRSFADDLSYKEVAYIPSTFALDFGTIFHFPPHVTFIFGRLINLWVYSIIVFFAIRKLVSGKMILSVIALLPTAIFLASNYGYDWWVTAFTMLGMAYFFSEMQQPDKKLSRKEAVIMVGSLVIGIGPKAIYFLLIAPLLLLKSSKFESLKEYKIYVTSVILALLFVAGSFVLPFLMSGEGGGGRRAGLDVDTPRQIQYILHNPVEYTKTLLTFIVGYINPITYSGFTNFLAYLGMTRGFWFILFLLGFVLFTDKNAHDKKTSNWQTRSFILAISFITISLITTALYLSFSVVGSNEILGVQPRYLIPLLFPVLFILGSSRFKNSLNKNIYNGAIFSSMAFVLLWGIWELIIKNYY